MSLGVPAITQMALSCVPSGLFRADCLNAKSSEERVVYKKAELNGNVDSENNHGGSSRTWRSANWKLWSFGRKITSR